MLESPQPAHHQMGFSFDASTGNFDDDVTANDNFKRGINFKGSVPAFAGTGTTRTAGNTEEVICFYNLTGSLNANTIIISSKNRSGIRIHNGSNSTFDAAI